MVINRYSPISMHAHTHIYTYIHMHMVYQKIKACLGSLVTEWIYMKYPFSANTFFLKCWLKIERNDSFSWTIRYRFLFKQNFSRLAILTFLAFLLLTCLIGVWTSGLLPLGQEHLLCYNLRHLVVWILFVGHCSGKCDGFTSVWEHYSLDDSP